MLYRQPFPTEEEVREMYEDEGYLASAYFKTQRDAAKRAEGPEVPIYRQGLDGLEAVCQRKRRLLDVGSGTGLFLTLARERGWDVEGIEISSAHAEFARRQHGLEVQCGDFATVAPAHAPFDAITLWDVLEHVPRPWGTLARARELLKPEGVLVIFTINSASLFNKLAHVAYLATGGRLVRPIELLCDRRHDFYFTQPSLESLVRAAGLSIHSRTHHRAHLARWLSEPAPWWIRAGSEVIDVASVPLRLHYRQLLLCTRTNPEPSTV